MFKIRDITLLLHKNIGFLVAIISSITVITTTTATTSKSTCPWSALCCKTNTNTSPIKFLNNQNKLQIRFVIFKYSTSFLELFCHVFCFCQTQYNLFCCDRKTKFDFLTCPSMAVIASLAQSSLL